MIYLWNGIDQNGQQQHGTIKSQNAITASKELNQQNITLLKIRAQKNQHRSTHNFWQKLPLKPNALNLNNKKIKATQLASFMQQLAFLINAHVPLVTSLATISKDQHHLPLQYLINNIKNDIEAGTNLTTSLQRRPQYFSKLWCNLINTGEQSGTLDVMLKHIATHITKDIKQKHKVIKALLYPMLVLLVGLIVTAILLIFVIPQFQEMFNNFGATLPAYTRLIITIADFLKNYGGYLLGGIILATITMLIVKKQSPQFSHRLDHLILQLPFYGTILRKSITTQFARILYITINAGFPLLEALAITSSNISNWRYQQSIQNIQNAITNGRTLHAAMREQNLFAERVLQLVSLGEEAGNLDNMLDEIANHYDEEIDYTIDNLNNLLEPLLMITLGVIVGGLIVGMYLPIFQLGNVI